jgi:DNA-3-methyladenine glycosylase I
MHDESKHFEMLLLETMQAGLSRWTILQRRENYRNAFAKFDAKKVARFDDKKIEELMQNSWIIRNRAKIKATVTNATKFLEIQQEFGSFDAYIWWFTKGKVVDNKLRDTSQFVSTSPLSDEVSKDMKKRWFVFVWSTTIYAHLQAIGVINDHMVQCFRYKEVKK